MFAASPSPTMEAAFGRLHKAERAAFGGAPTFVESIVGDGEAVSVSVAAAYTPYTSYTQHTHYTIINYFASRVQTSGGNHPRK